MNNFSHHVSALVCVLCVAALSGCALIPREKSSASSVQKKEQVADTAQTSLERALKSETPTITMPVTSSGNSNTVSVSIVPPKVESVTHQATVAASETRTDNQSAAQSSVTIPFAVKLILSAAGLALLLGVIWFARKNSAALDSALKAADSELAQAIGNLEARLHTAPEPEKVSTLTQLNQLNKTRGKLALQRKAP